MPLHAGGKGKADDSYVIDEWYTGKKTGFANYGFFFVNFMLNLLRNGTCIGLISGC
jgi:hypothetical protein